MRVTLASLDPPSPLSARTIEDVPDNISAHQVDIEISNSGIDVAEVVARKIHNLRRENATPQYIVLDIKSYEELSLQLSTPNNLAAVEFLDTFYGVPIVVLPINIRILQVVSDPKRTIMHYHLRRDE